jgi:hypothetical protein
MVWGFVAGIIGELFRAMLHSNLTFILARILYILSHKGAIR